MPDARQLESTSWVLLVLSLLLFTTLLFKHASYPLMWQEESATAMFGAQVLEYGYPRVYEERSAIYPGDLRVDYGIGETGNYRGGLWGSYYVAAIAELFARGAEDPWDRTGRLRVFFGLLGCAGLGIFFVAIAPLLGGPSRRRVGLAAFFGLLACSVSFLLHVREVGPLAPTLLLLGAVLCLVMRVERARVEGAPLPGLVPHTARLVLLLCLLGSTSALVSLATLAALLFHGLGRRLVYGRGSLLFDLLPLLLAALLLQPVISGLGEHGLRWDLLGLQREEEAAYGASLRGYLLHLLRYEWLGPVVVARLALMVAGRLGSAAPAGAGQASRLAAGNLLTLFLGVYLAVLAALPVFLERHAVVLSPVLALLLVLDTSSLLAWFRAQEGGLRRLGFAGLAGVAAAFMLGAWLHAPDLRGRLHEITNRYRGPLDQVVAYAQEGYENPADLVIATNSEGIGLRYYLGCIVIVDTFPTRLAQDFMYQPDLIVPRPSGRSQRQLGQLAVRARYDQEDLPVRNLVANNVPTLSPRDASGSVHLFESAELPEGTPGMPVLERVRSAGQGPRKPPE